MESIMKDFKIKMETWKVFEGYLEQTIDYLESFEMDFELETLRDQLSSILNYDYKSDFME